MDYIVRATAADSQIRAFAVTTKEMVVNIEDILCVREVTSDKQFHFEVNIKNAGWLKMADMLIGVEIIKDGMKHRGIKQDDFPSAEYKV